MVQRIDALRPQLLELNEWMYRNPESGHQELKAVEKITGFLKDKGWSVEVGLNKLPDKWEPVLEQAFKIKTLPTYFKATYPGQSFRARRSRTSSSTMRCAARAARPFTAASTTCRARSASARPLLWPST